MFVELHCGTDDAAAVRSPPLVPLAGREWLAMESRRRHPPAHPIPAAARQAPCPVMGRESATFAGVARAASAPGTSSGSGQPHPADRTLMLRRSDPFRWAAELRA